MPTLTATVVNNEDGTATVTVAGISNAANTLTLYTQNVNLQIAANNWSTQGTRVGNGTISVALSNGFYYFYVEESTGGGSVLGASPPIRSRVDDGGDDIFTRCLEAVQATVRELDLTGVPDDRVHLRTVPQDSAGLATPCVFVFPFGSEGFAEGAGTNLKDEIIYPVMVAFIKAGNQDNDATPRDLYLLNRQRISDAFRNQRLAGVPESIMINTSYREVISTNAWLNHNLFAGGIVLNIKIWQSRGMT